MLRHQWVVQKARKMALHYISHAGVVYTPEDFIKKAGEMEHIFTRLLLAQQDSK